MILAGVGDGIPDSAAMRARSDAIARGLEGAGGAAGGSPAARAFRAFAERQGNDLAALAAIPRARS